MYDSDPLKGSQEKATPPIIKSATKKVADVGSSALFETPPLRSDNDLLLLAESGKVSNDLFLKTVLGESPIDDLPLVMKQDSLLTSVMEGMRDFSAEQDLEQHGGVYRDSHGDISVLTNPTVGGWNGIDRYYFAGPLPRVEDGACVIDIHSHPPGLKFASQIVSKEDLPEAIKATSHLPSYADYDPLILKSKEPSENSIQASVTVGQGLATLICRTKDTGPKLERKQERAWVFADVLNNLQKIQLTISQEHPDYTELEKLLLTVGKSCQEHHLGLYFMRLRPTGNNSNLWVRFNPWPKNLGIATDALLS